MAKPNYDNPFIKKLIEAGIDPSKPGLTFEVKSKGKGSKRKTKIIVKED